MGRTARGVVFVVLRGGQSIRRLVFLRFVPREVFVWVGFTQGVFFAFKVLFLALVLPWCVSVFRGRRNDDQMGRVFVPVRKGGDVTGDDSYLCELYGVRWSD